MEISDFSFSQGKPLMSTTNANEGSPIRGIKGLWHNADGSFASTEQSALYDQQEQNLQNNQGEQESRLNRLIEKFNEDYNNLVLLTREIEKEIGNALKPVTTLARQFSRIPKATAAKISGDPPKRRGRPAGSKNKPKPKVEE